MLLSAASLYCGSRWERQASLLSGEETFLKSTQERMGSLLARLEPLAGIPEKNAGTNLDSNMAEVMLLMMHNRVADAIRIDQVESLAPVHPVNNLDDFHDLEQSLSDTQKKMKEAPIRVKGQYSSYPGFKAFLKALHVYPVAITGLNEQGRDFELKLEVFGR